MHHKLGGGGCYCISQKWSEVNDRGKRNNEKMVSRVYGKTTLPEQHNTYRVTVVF